MRPKYDVVVVGSGPNGLTAAIVLAQQGLAVCLLEAAQTAGGGTRSSELTVPGFIHDECSAVHPLGIGSPFFKTLALERYGLQWVQSPSPLAHVMTDGSAVLLERSLDETVRGLGVDGPAYHRLLRPFVDEFDPLIEMLLAPLKFPRRPFLMGRFGLKALRSMEGLARSTFKEARASAMLAGIAAHAMIPLDQWATASFGLVLAAAGHAVGWPIARGGSQAIANALLAHFKSLGGELVLGQKVIRLDALPTADVTMFDVGPRQLLSIAGDALPASYHRKVNRFRYGPGAYKVDWALNAPIPWKDPACGRAVTVHLAGTMGDIVAAQKAVNQGALPERPFVLLGQPSIVDDTRAPKGMHTVWAYCHVPNGSPIDATKAIEAQIERYAPGFKDCVVARHTRSALALEAHNPNNVGGDINGGLSDLPQLFFRPVLRADPYSTPNPGIFLCSSSTPPGGGVHGMCGYWAARSALNRLGRALPAPAAR